MRQRQVRSLLLATSLLACAGSVAQAQFTISNPGTNPNTFVGQNFSPSTEPTPNPGAPGTVYLQSFNFTSAGTAANTGNVATRLVILPGAYYDTNGNPNGSFTPTIADVTGISTNTLDTANGVSGAPLNFTFNNLALTYGNSYAAVFATVGAGDTLSFINVRAMYVNYVETSPGSGVFVPVANYGGSGNFNANALYADFNGDGFFEADNNTADAAFTATFVVPETTSLTIVGVAAIGLLSRRRSWCVAAGWSFSKSSPRA